jgi:hypothetical protein
MISESVRSAVKHSALPVDVCGTACATQSLIFAISGRQAILIPVKTLIAPAEPGRDIDGDRNP